MKHMIQTAVAAALALGILLPAMPAVADDCPTEPRDRQKPVPIVVLVRDGEITLQPPAEQAVHLKQKAEFARWISTDGPFEIDFDDPLIEKPVCDQSKNNQWECESAAFCYDGEGTNQYKYTVTSGAIILDPLIIIDP